MKEPGNRFVHMNNYSQTHIYLIDNGKNVVYSPYYIYCSFNCHTLTGDRQLDTDELEPEETMRRLGVLAGEMDANKDGFVSRDELVQWIKNSARYNTLSFLST